MTDPYTLDKKIETFLDKITKLDGLSDILTAIQNQGTVKSATATITNSPTILLLPLQIVAANPNRKGLIIYNNSANSVYLTYGQAGNSNTLCTRILATFTQFEMPQPIYTGAIWGIRNSGTGFCVVTELT